LLNLAQGLSLLFGVLILFLLALSAGRSDNEIRSIVFSALIIGNLLLITINLSWELNLFKILQSAHPVVLFDRMDGKLEIIVKSCGYFCFYSM
jgi:Ca2+-transporting ATPase